MRPIIGILTLTGVLALNAQIYVLMDRASESIADAVSGAVAQGQPEAVQRKLEELERLRASNAALQAVVASLSSSPSVGERAPASYDLSGGSDFSFFPVLPLPGEAHRQPSSPARTPVRGQQAPPHQKATGESAGSPGRLLVTPIRTKDDGALVYLAFDKVVRVVRINGRLHGVDGYYAGVEDGVAKLVINGKQINLPLLVLGT